MKKLFFFALLVITFVSILNAQNIQYGRQFDYPTEWGYLIINEDTVIQDDKVYKSKIYKDDHFTFLEKDNNKYIVLTCDYGAADFVTLVKQTKSKGMKDYFGNWEIYYFALNDSEKFSLCPMLKPFSVLNADSHIEEKTKDGKTIIYLPELLFINYNPWAVRADEKEKTIYLNTRIGAANIKDDPFAVKEIVIANGFICTEKPYLYEQNSRAKTILVTNGIDVKTYVLEDTPNFQIVPLNFVYRGKEEWDLKIKILDYYPGTKYSDVVISGIYYVGGLKN